MDGGRTALLAEVRTVSQPGTRLRALAARVCSEKTMERLIDPVIADLHVEYATAIGMTRRWLALVEGYVAFAKVSLWCGVLGLREARRNWSGEEQQGLLRDAGLAPNASIQRLMVYLLPSIMPLSIPVGLAIGAALGVQGRTRSRRLIAAVMLVALVLSAVAFVTIGWITPNSNQAYRQGIIGARLVDRGDRELTLFELRRSLAARDQESARRASTEFHQRLSVAIAPVTFAAFGLVVAIRRRLRTLGALGIIILAAFGYDVAMWAGRVVLPAPFGPWMPPVALIITTLVLSMRFGIGATRTRA
jgi:hypothetical protein